MKYILEYFDLTAQQIVSTSVIANSIEQATIKAMKILGDKDYIDSNLYKDTFDGTGLVRC